MKGPSKIQESNKAIRQPLEEAIVELNGRIETLTRENQSLKEGESEKERQLKLRLEAIQKRAEVDRERNMELSNNLQAQSKISNQLQKSNDRLKLRIEGMSGEIHYLQQKKKMLQDKWKQAKSTTRAQASEIQRLKKLGESVAKEADVCFEQKNEERGKRLKTEAAMCQLETHLDDMAAEYRRREQSFYRGGTFALSRIQDAYTRMENLCPTIYASGNIPAAEKLQSIMSILGTCMGKGQD